ncbi:hypothetical protein ACQPW3_22850 [Actinosynnema sp. CA-248983]
MAARAPSARRAWSPRGGNRDAYTDHHPRDSDEAEELSTAMRAAWTAFAAHGDPGRPTHDTPEQLTRLFDARLTVAACPEARSHRIWQDHTFPVAPAR